MPRWNCLEQRRESKRLPSLRQDIQVCRLFQRRVQSVVQHLLMTRRYSVHPVEVVTPFSILHRIPQIRGRSLSDMYRIFVVRIHRDADCCTRTFAPTCQCYNQNNRDSVRLKCVPDPLLLIGLEVSDHSPLLFMAIVRALTVLDRALGRGGVCRAGLGILRLLLHSHLRFVPTALDRLGGRTLSPVSNCSLCALFRFETRRSQFEVPAAHDRHQEIEEPAPVRIGIDTRDSELRKISSIIKMKTRGLR